MQTQTAWLRLDADCWKPLLLKWWVGYSLPGGVVNQFPILLPPPLKAFQKISDNINNKDRCLLDTAWKANCLLFHLSNEYVCPGTSIIAIILPEPSIPSCCSPHPCSLYPLDLIKWIVHLHLWQSSVQPKSSVLYMSVTNTVQYSAVMSVCDTKLIRA